MKHLHYLIDHLESASKEACLELVMRLRIAAKKAMLRKASEDQSDLQIWQKHFLECQTPFWFWVVGKYGEQFSLDRLKQIVRDFAIYGPHLTQLFLDESLPPWQLDHFKSWFVVYLGVHHHFACDN